MPGCSKDRPWGIHPALRSDEDCPRCGWTAPGPLGDALADALAAGEAQARAAELGWRVLEGGSEALAAWARSGGGAQFVRPGIE